MSCLMFDDEAVAGLIPADESVSVTADGAKNYGQLLNELYAMVNTGKVSRNSALVRTETSGRDTALHMIQKAATYLVFSAEYVSDVGDSPVFTMILQSSGSSFKSEQIGSATIANISSAVPASGLKLTLYY